MSVAFAMPRPVAGSFNSSTVSTSSMASTSSTVSTKPHGLPQTQTEQPQTTAGRITQIAENLDHTLSSAIDRIGSLNTETKFIAINAKMEAMRAGGNAGKAFGVVAQAVQKVSNQTAEVASRLAVDTRRTVDELHEIQELLLQMRGERLADLALTAIDLIDRNLYERTCDVRWWATDASVVQACESPTPEALAHATRRMGQILDAYTVYFDIVLVDLEGRVIANGRPSQFRSVGTIHADRGWFRTAMSCASGEEFGFRSVTPASLAGGQRCLVYSCGVREGGQPQGHLLGVLAVVFRWDALGQVIAERSAHSAGDGIGTRVVIADQQGKILADTERRFGHSLAVPDRSQLFGTARGHAIVEEDGERQLIGHAISPGFETYATGWHALVMQRLS